MNAPRFPIALDVGDLKKSDNALVFNPADDREFDQLADAIAVEVDRADLHAEFHALDYFTQPRQSKGEYDRALVFLGKHSEANKSMVGRAWARLVERGDLLIEGAKTDGVDSLIRGLRALGLAPNVEPKSHGKIIWLTKESNRVGAIDAWAAADEPTTNQDGFVVRPGIFSAREVDKGTAFLLENLPVISGVVGDYGSGYGALAREVLAKNPDITSLDMFELSHLAYECGIQNVTDERAHHHWLSVTDAPRAYFNVIVSNPPFHHGRAGDPSLGWDFIDAAARGLRARGTLYLVANRHLPYEQRLNARFGHVEVMAQSNAFKIFKATRPSSKGP